MAIHKRAHRGLVAWLAFVALALAMFAPSFSRLLQPVHGHSVVAASTGDCPEHQAHVPHPGMPEHPGMPADDEACGYCTLMCHSPALASGVSFIVFPVPAAPFSVAFGGVEAPVPLLLDQRSRGPPVA
jgi:hypothetical protein